MPTQYFPEILQQSLISLQFLLTCPESVFFQHTSEYDLGMFALFGYLSNFICGGVNFYTFQAAFSALISISADLLSIFSEYYISHA